MNKIDTILEEKYGAFRKEKGYLFNGVLSKFSSAIYLNVLFIEPKYKENISYLKSNGVYIPKEVDEFYQQYNGLALFSHSLAIFGYITSLDMGYTPLGMQRMNMMTRLKNKSWDDNYLSIGKYSSFDFCLSKKGKDNNIYVIERRTCKLVRTFCSFNELLDYCINKLSKLYDKEGYKINRPSGSDSWLDNMSLENIF